MTAPPNKQGLRNAGKQYAEKQIKTAFQREDLIVYTEPDEFKAYLYGQLNGSKAVLLMSSGNYGGLDLEDLKASI